VAAEGEGGWAGAGERRRGKQAEEAGEAGLLVGGLVGGSRGGGGRGLLLLGLGLGVVLLHVGGPEGEVVAKKLHDERRVLVRLLAQRVELGDGLVESLLGEVASAIRCKQGREDRSGSRGLRARDGLRGRTRVEDLVVEDREVEGQAEADGVRRRELGDSDVRGGLVGLERLVGRVGPLVAGGELGEVPVVVSHPAVAR